IAHIENLLSALDNAFKDGYFMRAVTDYGEELGVRNCKHFSKDLLCQSWSVIANISSKQKQRSALQSAGELVDGKVGIIKLLSPAQTKERYYGYISSYPKGVRENGGQYTHAAVWFVKAVAMLDEKIETGDGIYDANDLLDMINPISKNLDEENSSIYKGEPYVLSGDVYTNEDNYGRSGWSWYTGSASILYDTIVRDFLGISICGNKMTFSRPKLRDWQDMKLIYRYKGTVYSITFAKGAEDSVKADGIVYKGDTSLTMQQDLGKRSVEITFR
ncbi:MAG: hypothetical protein K2O08_05435, partial [Clostridia bacterium]|nr:hypothetical protein [Clostridia bacterium]